MKYDTFIRFIIVFLVIQLSPSLYAQEECIDCHSDDTLTMERQNKEVSLFVHTDNFAASAHGDIECIDCHENFDAEELPHMEGSNIAKVNCSNCHDGYQEQVDNDIHSRLGEKVGNRAPNCITCHGTHEVKPPSMVKNTEREYCGKCHTDVNLNGKYHTTQYLADANCAECHEVEGFSENLTKSVHDGLVCADCHVYEVNNFDLHQEGVPHISKATCSTCHKEAFDVHKESIHGVSLAEGIDEAATCWDCHGSHMIQPPSEPGSGLHNGELVNTCGECHNNQEFVEKFNMSVNGVSDLYIKSVHGQYNEKSGSGAANCASCHGTHDIKSRTQEGSKISAYNIPNTCSPCHEEITKEFEESIHWIQAKKGVRHSPVCNDCHSEHSIHAVNGAFKKEEIKKLQEETCLVCHQDPRLLAKYSIEGAALEYQDSYHGLAVMRGDEDAAMCVDCHNVHKILPQKHPESSVNEANVQETCQKCHPDASEKFSISYSHVTQSEEARFIEGVVENIYFWMVVVVIGGMLLHNLLIIIYESRKRRKKEKNSITIPRFTKNEVIQHFLLLTSFILLAITGFALKYPFSFWAEGLRVIGMDETIRQNMHRISAVVMIVLSFYHAFYLVLTKRGRDVLVNMVPKLSDMRQAVDTVLYYLRIIKTKPKYGKYDYTEKAEYWALIWGTIVMGVTGLVLWFPTLVGDWAPIWFIKVNEIIHFYEAILASLAILVWHWFFVIFHPNEYPMNFTWVDGHMSLEGYRHHHELHFREVLLAWKKHKDGKIERKDFKHSTELFISTFEENNINPDDVFENELKNDPELRDWLRNNQ